MINFSYLGLSFITVFVSHLPSWSLYSDVPLGWRFSACSVWRASFLGKTIVIWWNSEGVPKCFILTDKTENIDSKGWGHFSSTRKWKPAFRKICSPVGLGFFPCYMDYHQSLDHRWENTGLVTPSYLFCIEIGMMTNWQREKQTKRGVKLFYCCISVPFLVTVKYQVGIQCWFIANLAWMKLLKVGVVKYCKK